MSAAYDTVNHRLLLTKLYGMTEDAGLTKFIGSMLSNRRFYVELNVKKSSLIYADDLCIATQRSTFEKTETILTESLYKLSEYYERKHWCANPDKTHICAFHLKNQDASRKFNIAWYNKHLEHIPNPVYMGVNLERTLSYKEHIHKLKCKRSARNTIVGKLSNTKWVDKPATIKTTALALYYSMAEYACPERETSTHVSKLEPSLNEACRTIAGCLRPTSVENV